MKQKNSLATGVAVALLAGALIFAAGCAPQSAPAPAVAPTTPVASTPGPVSPPSNPVSESEPAELTLTINTPEDNAIVATNKIAVAGNTSPDAVVSINEEILVADSNGNFSTTITLAEGPNIIQIIASDDAGNTAEAMIIVTYEKGG
jgi:hypothetical protein